MGRWDIDDNLWEVLKNELRKEDWRGKETEKRNLINAVLYLLSEIKGKYELQLHWKKLNEINGQEYLKYANSDSLRETFGRWRNKGIWEKLLPLLAKRSKYKWVLANGTYEVLLRSSKIVRDRNLVCNTERVRQDKLRDEEHAEELSRLVEQYEEEAKKRDKTISEQKAEIALLNKTITSLKGNAECKKLKIEIEHLTQERNKYMKENIDLKRLNKKYIVKLYKTYNYNPASSKNVSQEVLDNFREVLKEARDEEDTD